MSRPLVGRFDPLLAIHSSAVFIPKLIVLPTVSIIS